jgi:predicted  nucleic acid-binding Zn-ribbon protein
MGIGKRIESEQGYRDKIEKLKTKEEKLQKKSKKDLSPVKGNITEADDSPETLPQKEPEVEALTEKDLVKEIEKDE